MRRKARRTRRSRGARNSNFRARRVEDYARALQISRRIAIEVERHFNAPGKEVDLIPDSLVFRHALRRRLADDEGIEQHEI